ncbi:ERF family protein [Tianweitania sediminis]|uniref:ERF family protein n=1 Tax=Tianweitania sediminis TaxID=1502156 RepID=A0A8J7ULV7_9HYPH|nr:ERF family protein [Tianweitania sediminis]MBP0441360.1 ERF family protein [Tianweitania sediminis]
MNVLAPQEEFAEGIIPTSEGAIIALIERVVMDPSISIDRLHQMLLFKERMEERAREDEARAAEKAYFAAMSRCQAELPIVTKSKVNKHTNSSYADLAAIEEQAMPVIYQHGFAVSFQPDGYNNRGELRILWEISHEGGYRRNGLSEIPIDGDSSQGRSGKTATQTFGSTATYGRRYLLCMLFNISTGDDRDGNPVEAPIKTITPAQVKTIQRLLKQTGSDASQFCRMHKIEAIPDLPGDTYENALRLLYQRRAKLNERSGA